MKQTLKSAVQSFNKPLTFKSKHQAGITLIEVSVGLIIAAVVAAAAFIAFQNNTRRNEVQSNTQSIAETVAELKQKFGRTNLFNTITTAQAISSAAISPNLVTSSTTAANSYNGTISVGNGGLAAGDNSSAVLVWSNVPKAQCLDLLIGVESGAAAINVAAAGTADATATPTGTAVKTATTAFNAATASGNTACGGTASRFDLVFTVSKA
jgi:type II secretory pathway pseudopilin PulG